MTFIHDQRGSIGNVVANAGNDAFRCNAVPALIHNLHHFNDDNEFDLSKAKCHSPHGIGGDPSRVSLGSH